MLLTSVKLRFYNAGVFLHFGRSHPPCEIIPTPSPQCRLPDIFWIRWFSPWQPSDYALWLPWRPTRLQTFVPRKISLPTSFPDDDSQWACHHHELCNSLQTLICEKQLLGLNSAVRDLGFYIYLLKETSSWCRMNFIMLPRWMAPRICALSA